MDESKFNSFMNDVMTTGTSTRDGNKYWDTAFGDKRDEIIALHTEHKLSNRSILDSLIKAGIVGEERTLGAFTTWMAKAIKKNNAKIETEVHKALSASSAKISMKE